MRNHSRKRVCGALEHIGRHRQKAHKACERKRPRNRSHAIARVGKRVVDQRGPILECAQRANLGGRWIHDVINLLTRGDKRRKLRDLTRWLRDR